MGAVAESQATLASRADRVAGYDIARALAILGMVVVHFSLVMAADRSGPVWLAEVLGFLDGRAAATFVVLAGVGITLLSRRAVASADPAAVARTRKTLVCRGLFLLVIGFLNLLVWPGDILRIYGVSLLLTARLITATDRRLFLGALGYALGFVVLFIVVDFGKNWEWETLTYKRLWTPSGLVRNLFFDGFRSVLPWTGFVFFGMWLGRLNLRDRAVNRRVLLAGVGVVVLAEVTSWLCVRYFLAHPHGMDAETVKALFGSESMPALPLFLLAAGGTAVAILASSVRVAEACPPRLLRPLTATGQMALTWYFAHIFLGLGAVVALGLVSAEPLPVAAGCGLLFFAVAVLSSWLWKKVFRHGPLERLMRAVAG
ncbi:MAG TPA: heparan-alpha-glucosaminide N-acetyltransferase domain-containing protein [Gemmataceae bacterium]|nr:heparan-alpha-glucosaminide N-acetyltransferase domain-containing protein [Gemmataceae bacterium]